MNSFEINKNVWSEIYKSGKNNLSYPNENLVRILHYMYNSKNISDLKVLDYGFGSGNNLLHLCKIGFDVYGIEISEDAKLLAIKKLEKDFNREKLYVLNNGDLSPFTEDTFDLIIAWQSIYYNSSDNIHDVILNIYNLLKPGGVFLGTMIRKEDSGAINSLPTSGYERIMTSKMGDQNGSIILVLPTEEDILKMFNIFTNIEIGYFESKIKELISSHWIITGEKIL